MNDAMAVVFLIYFFTCADCLRINDNKCLPFPQPSLPLPVFSYRLLAGHFENGNDADIIFTQKNL